MPNENAALALSLVARFLCIFIAMFSLFGFLFIRMLTPDIMAGIFALAAALIPASRPGSDGRRSMAILVLSLLGLCCQVGDVVSYYMMLNNGGNYYWWPGSLFYFFTLSLMAACGLTTLRASRWPAATATTTPTKVA